MAVIKYMSTFIGEKKCTLDDLNISSDEKNKAMHLGMDSFFITEKYQRRELAINAVKKLLDDNNIDTKDINIIISCSGLTKDYINWCEAAYIQYELNMDNAYCFDVYQGCNSFLQAISIANSIIDSSDRKQNVIVTGCDKAHINVNNSFLQGIVFGDGAAAVLLSNDGDGYEVCGSSNSTVGKFNDMTYDFGGCESRITKDNLENKDYLYGVRNTTFGKDIKEESLKNFNMNIMNILKNQGLNVNDIRYHVFPNTNKPLYLEIANELGVSTEHIDVSNVRKYGHMGCVDTFINLNELDEKVKKDEYITLNCMGSGLSWCSLLLKKIINNE